MKLFKKKIETLIIEDMIKTYDDEALLVEFVKFLDRIDVSTQFIQDSDGLLTHQVLFIKCGEKMANSDPMQLDWPLQPLPMPDAFKDKNLVN